MEKTSSQALDISIGIIAYNHEPYIAQAIESVLSQEGDFNLKIVILEDCSTDNTLVIIEEYKKRFPELIRVFANNVNKGHFHNFRDGLRQLNAKYIAILDGDDYWTDNNKLLKQIRILEENPDLSGVCHNVLIKKEGYKDSFISENKYESITTIEDIISGGVYHHTSSLVYRNYFKGNFPDSYYVKGTGDWFMSMLFAEYGPIKYIPDVMSVYRIHDNGLWSGLSGLQRIIQNIEASILYNKLLKYRYKEIFDRKNWMDSGSLIKRSYNELRVFQILKYGFMCLSLWPNLKYVDPFYNILVRIPSLIMYRLLDIFDEKEYL